jgi:hypothetical protein
VLATGDLFFNFNEAFIALFMTLLLAWMTLFAGFGTWSLAAKKSRIVRTGHHLFMTTYGYCFHYHLTAC